MLHVISLIASSTKMLCVKSAIWMTRRSKRIFFSFLSIGSLIRSKASAVHLMPRSHIAGETKTVPAHRSIWMASSGAKFSFVFSLRAISGFPQLDDLTNSFLTALSHEGIDRHHPADSASAVDISSPGHTPIRMASLIVGMIFDRAAEHVRSSFKHILVAHAELNTRRLGALNVSTKRPFAFEQSSKPSNFFESEHCL